MFKNKIRRSGMRVYCFGFIMQLLIAGLLIGRTEMGTGLEPSVTVNEDQKLLASDGIGDDEFGRDVAISGDAAVIRADFDYHTGSVYFFRNDGSSWVEEERLTGSDSQQGEYFGSSVSISGDVALVGARNAKLSEFSSGHGAAYVFRYDGSNWIEEAKLIDPAYVQGEQFGYSVSISGDVALIGSPYDVNSGETSGSAFVYRYNGSTWVYEAKLLPAVPEGNIVYGYSVSLSGDVAVIGAYYDDDMGFHSGSAYVFRYDGSSWIEEAKLLAADGDVGDQFGEFVSVSGDVALIASPLDDDLGLNSGSAYVFRYNGTTWNQEEKLLAEDGASYDNFGGSVSVWGNVAVIGAWGDSDYGSSSGSAYLFRFDGSNWIEESKLLPSDGAQYDLFGVSVATSGVDGLIGAPMDDDLGDASGSVYAFDLTVNTVPELNSGSVSPAAGEFCESFTFSAHYYDADADDAAVMDVYIDGDPFPMTLVSGTPSDGTYEYSTLLGAGDHTYSFYSEDGSGGSVWLPETGEYDGPSVSRWCLGTAEENNNKNFINP